MLNFKALFIKSLQHQQWNAVKHRLLWLTTVVLLFDCYGNNRLICSNSAQMLTSAFAKVEKIKG
jgi:hypothetical protein